MMQTATGYPMGTTVRAAFIGLAKANLKGSAFSQSAPHARAKRFYHQAGFLVSQLPDGARRKALEKYWDWNAFDDWWEAAYGCWIDSLENGFYNPTTQKTDPPLGYENVKPLWFDIDRASYAVFTADIDVKQWIDAHNRESEIMRAGRTTKTLKQRYPRLWRAILRGEYTRVHIDEGGYRGQAMIVSADSDLNDGAQEEFEAVVSLIEAEVEDLGGRFLTLLRDEYEYLTSEEQVIESLDANEVRFNIHGRQI